MVKILIVDDHNTTLKLITSFLKGKDYEILTATDAYHAIKVMATERPDMILLDINIPQINGFELCRAIRDDIEFKDIPIIMMSGAYGDDIARKRALNLGADAYLVKPFEKEELLSLIEDYITK